MSLWDAVWTCKEPNIEGAYNIWSMQELYNDTVDKDEYPDFVGWVWDMERSGTFCKCMRVANIMVLDAIDIVCGECCEYNPDAYDPCAGCPVRATADRLWKEQGVEIEHIAQAD